MGQRTLTGVIDPQTRHYVARYHQWGSYTRDLLPEVRRTWHDEYQCDTAAMAAAMATPTGAEWDVLWHGHLDEDPEFGLEQLTLLHPDHEGISVYHPDHHGSWLLSSRHRLASTADDLFAVTVISTDGTGLWTCTVCGAVDKMRFTSRPRGGTEPGSERFRTTITCEGCESSETTDECFAVTTTRTA